jgi:hypothetical protein
VIDVEDSPAPSQEIDKAEEPKKITIPIASELLSGGVVPTGVVISFFFFFFIFIYLFYCDYISIFFLFYIMFYFFVFYFFFFLFI